ncbi:beta-glucosidase [Lactobacillus psittaci]|nr:glycoside hydrolase family 3 N-terminal domain-containing protein [Lactobacillus psittaci]
MKNKKLRSMLISVGTIIALVLAVWGIGTVVINNLKAQGVVTDQDIQSTLQVGMGNILPIAIVLGLIIVLIIVFWNRSNKFNFWLKWESFIVFLITVVVSINTLLFGPLQGLMNANNSGMAIKQVKKSLVAKSDNLSKQIVNEGSVLLKNENDYLPIKAQKLNVFGWASISPIYGGTGSGQSNNQGAIDIYKSLNSAGFRTNNELKNFYTKYQKTRPVGGMNDTDWSLPEPKISSYSKTMMKKAEKYSDTALVVITRPGGEGTDLPTDPSHIKAPQKYNGHKDDWKGGKNYLELTTTERGMLDVVNKKFKNVVVLINSSNAMELGFLKEYSHIKAALWMAGTGTKGFSALGKILKGEVNPSGRTSDTYVYDLKKTPTYNNWGAFEYTDKSAAFNHYVENIYVGYKYWETKYTNDNSGYEKAVQFPFGYGLSYTKFEQKMSNLSKGKNGNFSFDVTVKNTGKRAGKDVVEAYFTAPYTNGGIEKSATNLLDFAKTKNLKPGQSQKLHFSFNQAQMASYDSSNGGAYVLDPGQYQIQIKKNAHDVIDSQNLSIGNKITYNANNKRPGDVVAASNHFQYAQDDGSHFTYLSRKDNFANYNEATKAPGKISLPASLQKSATITTSYKEPRATGKMPTQGQNTGLTLSDLRGKRYNDPKWEKLLNQMTIDDMNNLIAYGGYQTFPIKSIGKVGTLDFDGPAGFSSFFAKNLNTTGFPSATMIASTWNKDLAKKRGELVGKQGNQAGITGWYGPAMNIHRSAFGGRNFEYYSEDPTLAANMAANEIKGAQKYGVYAYMKHFAMNNAETNRNYMSMKTKSMSSDMEWNTEQAIREIYLRPFEAAVKTGGTRAVMSAFTMIGNRWSGANDALLNKTLRNEWGFKGFVETDYYVPGTMDATQSILNGGNLMLSTNGVGAKVKYTNNPTVVRAMRKASKGILYSVVNSNAYASANYKKGQSVMWPYQKQLVNITIGAAVVIAALQVLAIYLYRRKYMVK